jgi:two-component system, sensor histidine kinase PdtaS
MKHGDDTPSDFAEPAATSPDREQINQRESETKLDKHLFRRFADSIPTLNWMADADGFIFWFNRRWHEYCGTTLQEMEGWGWQSVHDPAELPDVLKIWTDSIKSGLPFELTFPLRGADGVFRPFLTRAVPDRYPDGSIAGWFGVCTEVTGQLEVEAQLRMANAQLAANAAERDAMLRQLSDGVILADSVGRITFINEAAIRLHGVEKLDVEPDEYSAAYNLLTMSGDIHPADTLPLTRAVRNLEVVTNARWRIRRPDGSEIFVVGNAQPFFDANGKAIGGVLTIHDDTNRYLAEQALEQEVATKQALLLEVNHRVKNSLQMVTSLLNMQAKKSTTDEAKGALLDAGSRISVFADMHHKLYNNGRHDRVEITDFLRDIAKKTVRALDPHNHIRLLFKSADEAELHVDHAIPLALLVSELLTNAVKHAFPDQTGGEIQVSVTNQPDRMEIGISDNGRGLAPDFDLKTGSSMGMQIVAALVDQVSGKLNIMKRDKGTAFLISLPASLFLDDGSDDFNIVPG